MTLSTRAVPGSSFEEIKVTTVSTHSLSSLCDAVWGKDAKVEGDFKKRVIIRETQSERWTYEQVHVPFVSDRDCVMHVKRVSSADTGRCDVLFETTSDEGYPEAPGHVRVGAVRGRWQLEPKEGQVQIIYQVYSEPGGRVPAFLARGGQRDAAVQFMKVILQRAGPK